MKGVCQNIIRGQIFMTIIKFECKHCGYPNYSSETDIFPYRRRGLRIGTEYLCRKCQRWNIEVKQQSLDNFIGVKA